MSEVLIGELANGLNSFLKDKDYTSIAVIVDNNTKKHCYAKIKKLLPKHNLVQIQAGESNKNIETCSQIWEQFTHANLDRHSLVINIGGGVIGDMGGFCSATYKRGIDFIQIPTTLLSQVDASVGGKLGIDFQGYKNHIGVFQIPNCVIIDSFFLKTLPKKELRSGFAEVIKHCLIKDKVMWQTIRKKDFEQQDYNTLIEHSVSIKKEITEADPTEKGLRKILNFGHTLGHAVETFYLGSENHLLHGEAIAVGMICEAFLSLKLNLISQNELNQIEEFVFSIYGKVDIKDDDIDEIVHLTLQDKKNKGNVVLFSLLNGIGNCSFDIAISKNDMKNAFYYYNY